MLIGYKFAQKLYDEEEQKQGMSTGMKLGLGTLASVAAFHGARKGVFGSTLRTHAGNAYAKLGNSLGSQKMMRSGLYDAAKGDLGMSAWSNGKKNFANDMAKTRAIAAKVDQNAAKAGVGSIGYIKNSEGKKVYGNVTEENKWTAAAKNTNNTGAQATGAQTGAQATGAQTGAQAAEAQTGAQNDITGIFKDAQLQFSYYNDIPIGALQKNFTDRYNQSRKLVLRWKSL